MSIYTPTTDESKSEFSTEERPPIVVAAPFGFTALFYDRHWRNEDGSLIIRPMAVAAWQVVPGECGIVKLKPVVAVYGNIGPRVHYVIEEPTGEVVCGDIGRNWPNRNEWIEAINREYCRRAQDAKS